ncbi:MAG TPA: hypothetical protein VIL99_16870 [Ignavibacteria bacterium]
MKIIANKDFLKKLHSDLETYNSKNGSLPESLQLLQNNLKMVESLDDELNIVKLQVYNVMSVLSGIDIDKINDNNHLKFDLGLNQTEKWILTKNINEILKDHNSKKFVTRDECNKLEYVSDCIKLVNSKLK